MAGRAKALEHRLFSDRYGPQTHEADYAPWTDSTLFITCEEQDELVAVARVILCADGRTPSWCHSPGFGGTMPLLEPCADWTTIAVHPQWRRGPSMLLLARTFLRMIHLAEIHAFTAIFDVGTLQRFREVFGQDAFVVADGAQPTAYAGSEEGLPVWTTHARAVRSTTEVDLYDMMYGSEPIAGTVDPDWGATAALCARALAAR